MDVVFITTTAANLDNVAVKNGQVISVRDCPGYYYDHDNSRKWVGGLIKVTNLPSLESLPSATPAVYLLTQYHGDSPPGVYVPNSSHTAWTCIASGTISEDAPDDGKEYIRCENEWKQPYMTCFCNYLSTDVQDLNQMISDFYQSRLQGGKIVVVGRLELDQGDQIIVQASGINKVLELDFSGCTIILNQGYESTVIDISYLGTQLSDGGCVIINGLNTLNQDVVSTDIHIDTIQNVQIKNCSFLHRHRDPSDYVSIDVDSSSPVIMTDCYILLTDTYSNVSTKPFMEFKGQSSSFSISNCMYSCVDSQEAGPCCILKINTTWKERMQFQGNMVFGYFLIKDVSDNNLIYSLNNQVY